MFVERVVCKVASILNVACKLTVQHKRARSFELGGGTKNSSKLWEFEIADNKEVKGKSKGNGCKFEITRNSK